MADLPDPQDRLDSWKEIALFLGRTVRTVQRWEKTEGLPVHRGGTAKRGGIVGSKKEIGEWWQRQGSTLHDVDEPDQANGHENGPSAGRGRLIPLAWATGISGVTMALVMWSSASNGPRSTDLPSQPKAIGRLLAHATTEGSEFASIPVGGPISHLALSPEHDRAYVALHAKEAIEIIDLIAGRVIDRIALHERVEVIRLNGAGTRLYAGGQPNVSIVNLSTNEVRRIPVGGLVRDLAVSDDDRGLWIALAQAGLRYVDLATGAIETRPSIGCPMYFASARSADRMFLSYQCQGPGGRNGHDAIEILELPGGRSLLARSGPPLVGSQLALSPDGRFLWSDTHDACAHPRYDQVGCPPGAGAVLHAFDATTLDRVMTIRVPATSFRSYPTFVPDGTRLVASVGGLHVINAALGHVEERVDVPGTTFAMFNAARSRLVVTDSELHRLLVVPLSSNEGALRMPGLAGYWPGDGTVNDLVGGSHGIDGSASAYSPGRLGRAFAFHHDDDEVSFGDRFLVEVPLEVATLGAWIRVEHLGSPMTMIERSGRFGFRWWITEGGRPAFCFSEGFKELACDSQSLIGSKPIAAGAWHHVALVRDQERVRLLIDGEAVGVGRVSLPKGADKLSNAGRIVRLGGSSDGRAKFRGLIDELVLFRRALSDQELKMLPQVTTLRRAG